VRFYVKLSTGPCAKKDGSVRSNTGLLATTYVCLLDVTMSCAKTAELGSPRGLGSWGGKSSWGRGSCDAAFCQNSFTTRVDLT